MASIDPLLRSLADYSTQMNRARVQDELSIRALKKAFTAQQQQALALLASLGPVSPTAGQQIDIYI